MNKLNQLYMEMIRYYESDAPRIQHFVKVHSFARLIGEAEGLDEETQFTLEAAALVHDIGIGAAEKKYGFSNGRLQEQEGPPLAEEMLEALNFEQEDRDFKDGYYIQEYIVHGFKTLSQEEYEDQKARYDQLAASYGYEEYKVVRVSFSQKWSPKALQKAPQWGDGAFTRDFAVGREAGLRERWKIFELGMM